MYRLVFTWVLAATLYAPLELTRCIIGDMPNVGYTMMANYRIELIGLWAFYCSAIIVLARFIYKHPQGEDRGSQK